MITAVVMPGPNQPLEVRSFPEPVLEPGAVLIKTIASEVCGTDVHLAGGQLAGVPYPIIPGHVSVGTVSALGPQSDGWPVTDINGVPVTLGARVTFLDVYGTCGRCWHCTVAGASTRCPHRRVYGVTMSAEEGLLGGWSEQIYLKPGTHILVLPDELEWRTFMAAGCGMPTALHAVTLADIRFGDTVAVQGAGPVGLCAAALAQLRGAGQVILLGGPQKRLAAAVSLGVDETIDVTTTTAAEREQAVRARTNGRGADITIEATGVPAAVAEGMRMTRDAGRYVVVGQYTNAGDVAINPHLDLNQKHLEVRGCWGSSVEHLYRSVQVLTRYQHRFDWQSMISHEYSLRDAPQALADAAAQRVVKALIVP
jgi:threonine dehydrogenase-like Zn-dependent dehydrogenase